jgi:hypothetical protein
MMFKQNILSFAAAAVLCLQGGADALATASDPKLVEVEAERIVSQYKTVMDRLPERVPGRTSPDGPLLGNGSMGAIITGKPDAWPLQFWICKNNFCKLRHDHRKTGPRPFGGLNIHIPALIDGSWHVEQELFPAMTTATFVKDDVTVNMRSFIAATDDIMIVELSAERGVVDATCSVWAEPGRGATSEEGVSDGIPWTRKIYHTGKEKGGTHPAEIETSAVVAWRILENESLKLEPGKPIRIAVSMQSNFDSEDPQAAALAKVAGLTAETVKTLEQDHLDWWRAFWAESLVEFDEPTVQRYYYLSQFVLGSAMRDKEFPPGLFGMWTTHDDPCWAGDYHLNFDYQSQFYGLYKNNHLTQADTYDQPILDFMERGKYYAKNALGIRGVYYPVGIWAKGMESSRQPTRDAIGIECGGVFLGQKSNAAYSVVPMSMRWFHTYDTDYAKKVYPFVVEVANFWEDFLQYEPFDKTGLTVSTIVDTNAAAPAPVVTLDGVPVTQIPVEKLPPGRYVVGSDSIHENIHSGGDADINSVLSLGLVHNTFTLLLDMSRELGMDAERRDRWEHILTNLSKFPTFEKDGKTVFRYTEVGTEWFEGNSVGLQHIYPGGAIGLDDPELAAIGRNMVEAKGRKWFHDNGENSHYPAAVRVGYDPSVILTNLGILSTTSRIAINGLVDNTEQCSTCPNTVNEMMCMSHRQVLRLFPVWPKDMDARFWNLRAEGAFLVSSAFKGGAVQFVKIHSEKGRDCTVVNPWPGKKVVVYRDGKKVDTYRGDRFVMKTQAGVTVELRRKGSWF